MRNFLSPLLFFFLSIKLLKFRFSLFAIIDFGFFRYLYIEMNLEVVGTLAERSG